MSKKEFIARITMYALFGVIAPVGFLVWRFGLFQKVSSISIGGWGLVAIVLVAVFFIRFFKALKSGLPFSMLTQILDGLCKQIIPLIALTFCVYYLNDFTTEVFQFLCVLIVTRAAAIVFNPLPQWAHENKIGEDKKNLKSVLESLKQENK